MDHRELLLQFIASLTLCDHMRDVATDIGDVLERLGVEVEGDCNDYLGEVRKVLAAQKVTTLGGTPLWDTHASDEPR